MSKIAFEMRSKMGSMSDADFENQMNLTKSAFLEYLDDANKQEERCITEPGMTAPHFTAHTLTVDGGVSSDLFALGDLHGRPCSLIFGSYTCPVFRNQSIRMKELMALHGSTIQFVVVYVLETHPTDGWNTHSNKVDGVMYAQPQTLLERSRIARDWRDAYRFNCPVVLDWPDNRINRDYAGSPERLYVLTSDGIVTFKSERGPFFDSHLEDWGAAMKSVLSGT